MKNLTRRCYMNNIINELGELTGWLINLFFAATILNFILKYLSKHYMQTISKNPTIKKIFTFALKFFVKYHRWFGAGTIITLLIHFTIQATTYGLVFTGIAAGSVMILQFLLGIYGAFITKKKRGLWLQIHRLISLMLILSILIHII